MFGNIENIYYIYKLIENKMIKYNKIAVSSLTKGMYFIILRDGIKYITLKFIKM
jgi:hypothetical protein